MDLLPIRLSHLLSHSGVGAIVRGPQGLMIVQDIRNWTDRAGQPPGEPIPYVERVRSALGITQDLREPPIAKELKSGQVDGVCVPVTRFPFWMRCPNPKCGALYYRPWAKKEQNIDEPICTNQRCERKPRLEQVAWVLVDARGYLSDVDWLHLAHRNARAPTQVQCKVRDQLSLIDHGYERRVLKCNACGSDHSFRGDERIGFGQGSTQPWTRDCAPPLSDGSKDEPAQVLQINDSRCYSAVTDLGLVIPPESRARKGTPVDRLYRRSRDREKIDKARNPLAREGRLRELALEYRCRVIDVEEALAELETGYPTYGATFSPGQILEDEYSSFLDAFEDLRDDEDFVPRNRSGAWHELIASTGVSSEIRHQASGVRHLVRLDRLKAVKVLKGFRRTGDETTPPDLVGQADWLLAIELFGEGIFLTIDEERLKIWEANEVVLERLERLQPRFLQSGREAPNPLTPRFMLLHTLSHLIVRQLEFEGGYPAASLSERLYCSSAPSPMAGILIWVAVPDIAGSLGGLAELAEPNRFLGIFSRALEHARWCSLDPVCSEHEGQGPGLLNRAACHACALVPEPACDYGNTLLDRGFIKGDSASGMPSFFGLG